MIPIGQREPPALFKRRFPYSTYRDKLAQCSGADSGSHGDRRRQSSFGLSHERDPGMGTGILRGTCLAEDVRRRSLANLRRSELDFLASVVILNASDRHFPFRRRREVTLMCRIDNQNRKKAVTMLRPRAGSWQLLFCAAGCAESYLRWWPSVRRLHKIRDSSTGGYA